jgi:hypothetical protein
MLGLAILFIFGVYLAISIFATRYVMAWARENGRRAWLWGCIAGFAMYNLVFWDLIPTLIMHKYYCSTQAGFWPYKTFGKWESENPGILDTLKESLDPTQVYFRETGQLLKQGLPADTERYWHTQRFYLDKARTQLPGSLVKIENRFFDGENHEEIARSIDIWRGMSGNALALGGSPSQIREMFVLGWGNRGCNYNDDSIDEHFGNYVFQFWKSGRGK